MNMLKSLGAGGMTVAALVALTAAIYNSAFDGQGTARVRLATSAGAAMFSVLCFAGACAIFLAAYFFFCMANSPKPGLTVLDARSVTGMSVFSDAYLSERGKLERSRFVSSLRWFAGCWLCSLLLGFAMYLALRPT